MNYRKIWEDVNGPIPVDEMGRPYEIHHKDGDRSNDHISNLMCVSIEDHYKIHESQGNYAACLIMAERMSISYEDTCILAKKAAAKRDQRGEKNPSWGKPASDRVKGVWDTRDAEYRKQFGLKVSEAKKLNGSSVGEKNPMYGRSAVVENKLRWYNNGSQSLYVPEGTQPEGYVPGRGKIKWHK